jgi:hypothetical protein
MDECAFGVEISEDRSRCAIAKAWREAPGRMAVKLVWHGPVPVAPTVVDALYMADDPVDVAVDPRSQSATLCGQLAELGVVVKRLGAEDVAVAHGEFMDAAAAAAFRAGGPDGRSAGRCAAGAGGREGARAAGAG